MVHATRVVRALAEITELLERGGRFQIVHGGMTNAVWVARLEWRDGGRSRIHSGTGRTSTEAIDELIANVGG